MATNLFGKTITKPQKDQKGPSESPATHSPAPVVSNGSCEPHPSPEVKAEATAAVEKAKKAPTVYTDIQMSDGRTVKFAGKRQMQKESIVSEDGKSVNVRFDFRNGQSRNYVVTLDDPLLLRLAAHGAENKIGDETYAESTIDNQVLAVETMIQRLKDGSWTVGKKSVDPGTSSIILQALMEASGKSLEFVKSMIEKKLETTEGLTRKELFDSFRVEGTKTKPIIDRLEAEKIAKAKPKVSGDEFLSSLGAERMLAWILLLHRHILRHLKRIDRNRLGDRKAP